MLFKNTVTTECLALIRELQRLEPLHSFVLVGGTSLSLQLGHRRSIDMDFFTGQQFDISQTKIFLQNYFTPAVAKDFAINNIGLTGIIHNIKCDLVNWSVPWIAPFVEEEGIIMASLQDILAMKLDAVANRGAKKDYIDIYVLLQKYSWQNAIKFYRQKFPYNDLQQMLRHFIQVHRADDDEMPDCLWPIIWEDVKVSLIHTHDIYFKELEAKKQIEMAERDERLGRLIESRNKKKQP